ncbi:peptidylprolyl isomerase [Singulisphaera sp. Ch08]|uniref:peptidylprolyl isomerase n=1 Tax=Singulisphaera sp. Ch08 TaxID=3120278 RepID=A0AAU7CSP7_9BACT
MPPPLELPSAPPALVPDSTPSPAPSAGAAAGLPQDLPELSEPVAPSIPPMLPPPAVEAPSTDVPAKADSASVEKRDSDVMPAAADSTMIRSEIRPRNAQPAGKVAAQVGDEVITLNELRKGVGARLQGMDPSRAPSEEEVTMVAFSVLQELIERSIVVQEAKRELKKPEAFKMVMSDAEKSWRAEELDPMLRKYAATNEYELKQKLKESGVSLDELRDIYCRQHLSQSYMKAKIGPKMTVSLPEMREYYLEHLHDFDRPAQIVWREVVIDVDKCKSRTEARTKIDALLGRLRRGEEFAKLASAESHGPNKAKGGIWETSPGGYGVEAVNVALESLPIGRLSQVIESPTSYHIVRVEKRRVAGPASFAEVEIQDKIKNTIFNEKIRRETTAFIAKLRKQTLITTMFDRPAADPATVKAGLPR